MNNIFFIVDLIVFIFSLLLWKVIFLMHLSTSGFVIRVTKLIKADLINDQPLTNYLE